MLQGFISPAGSWNEVVLFGSLALRAKVAGMQITPSLGPLGFLSLRLAHLSNIVE